MLIGNIRNNVRTNGKERDESEFVIGGDWYVRIAYSCKKNWTLLA